MSRLSMDPELDDLERRRNHLIRKERREALRKEVEDMERRSEKNPPRERKPVKVFDDKVWTSRGIGVTDMRRRP